MYHCKVHVMLEIGCAANSVTWQIVHGHSPTAEIGRAHV